MLEWEVMVFLAVMFGIAVSSLLFMVSKFLNLPNLEVLAKRELEFAISSVIIFILLIPAITYILSIEKTILVALYNQHSANIGEISLKTPLGEEIGSNEISDINPVEMSIYYMGGIMGCFTSWVKIIYGINIILRSVSIDVWMGMPLSGGSAFSTISSTISTILNNYYITYLFYKVLVYFLDFINIFSLPVFLPAGIILRAFPPTRGAGAYLIAFTLSFQIIFPFVYLLFSFSYPYMTICSEKPGDAVKYLITSPVNSDPGLMQGYLKAYKDSVSNIVDKISKSILSVYTNICIFPFIAFSVLLTFTQVSSGLLATTVPEFGRGFIKLI